MLFKFLSAGVLVICGSSSTLLPFSLLLCILGTSFPRHVSVGFLLGETGRQVGNEEPFPPCSDFCCTVSASPWTPAWQFWHWQVAPMLHWTHPSSTVERVHLVTLPHLLSPSPRGVRQHFLKVLILALGHHPLFALSTL